MALRRGHLSDHPLVAIPLDAIGVDLVLESVRVQDRSLSQKPLMAKNVEFKLSLPVAPACDCVGTMHTAPQRGDVESIY